MRERLQATERKEEEAGEKWKAWAEKEAQVNAGKAVSSEGKKWQAKGKALPVETVTMAAQTDRIQEPKAIHLDDGIQTEVGLIYENLFSAP